MCRSDRRIEAVCSSIFYATAVATLIFFSTSMLRAQEPSSQSLREARRLEMESRQRALWNLGKVSRKPGEKLKISEAQRLAYQQFTEDYEMLQVANYALADAVGAGQKLDYGEARKQAAEVKKRASRLKETLLLPESEKDDKQKKGEDESLSSETLKPAVSNMNALVQSFVTNPMFQQLGTVDANHSAKARRDLDSIIRLSEQIRRRAEVLNKAAGKNL
ncbi:MAG TPA: hypothetical protein VF766_05575 [Pyrinomonadaceae bacterium]